MGTLHKVPQFPGGDAALAPLHADVDLHQHILAYPQLQGLGVDGPQQVQGVHGVDEGHFSHHCLDLVGLQVPDEVDLRALIGPGGQVGLKLLHPVLPAHTDPRGDGPAHRLIRLGLGGGAEGDLLRPTPRCLGGPGDPLPDLL